MILTIHKSRIYQYTHSHILRSSPAMSQVGIFDDEDDDNDDGNVAAVLMKAGILSMLEGVLKKRQRLGKKAAALLKTQVGRLVNMILHPNVQLRDREAIH